MESICALVDSVPEHELIALSCGNELLLKRAQRFVRVSPGFVRRVQFKGCVVAVLLSLSCRKRILATGGCSLFRMQLPDSTVVNEVDSKENPRFSTDASGVRRSSSVFADCSSEHSDSIIPAAPISSKKSTTAQADYERCDSPSARTVKNAHLEFSDAGADLGGLDLFFSPKRQETSLKNTPRTSASEDAERDDFYDDDFDIDDLNDYDFPSYYEEPPPSPVTSPNPRTLDRTIREGGPTTSPWEKKPATPPSAPKPSIVSSPGKHSSRCVFSVRQAPRSCRSYRFPTFQNPRSETQHMTASEGSTSPTPRR